MTLMRGSDIFNLALCDMAVLDLNAGRTGLRIGQQGKIVVRINDFSKMNKDGRAEVWASAIAVATCPTMIHKWRIVTATAMYKKQVSMSM